ncbi:MAG: hypothetical protein ACYC0X_10135 [Pirellulaceae bacterium]
MKKTSKFDDIVIVPPEAVVLGEYRAPHRLAVLTLLLGLFSFLALLDLTLEIVPLLTLVLGVATLRSLAANPEKIGRKAVLVGMALALFFGTWAPVHHVSREQWLVGLARNYTDAWLELVLQKRKFEAHQLHTGMQGRVPQGESLDEFYAKHPHGAELNKFFASEPLQTLATLPDNARIEFDRHTEHTTELYFDEIVLRYVAKYELEGEPRELPFRVFIKRTLNHETGDHLWQIEGVAKG